MFVRGSGSGVECKRSDYSFYKGIVIKNNDPLKFNRLKIFIPELSNQYFDEWIEKYDTFSCKAPGISGDAFYDTEMFEELSKLIPWAEPCHSIFGESSNFRYFKDGKYSTISDGNYDEGFFLENGEAIPSTSPAYFYDVSRLLDAYSSPVTNSSVKNNPYGFIYNPTNLDNKAKGIFGVPEVGAKLWVFHNRGDLNYPVYFGVYRDYREMTLINDTDNEKLLSQVYPEDFEN